MQHAKIDTTFREKASPIDFLWLELTNRCNLQCVHCYAESGPTATESDTMTPEDYIRVMDEAFALGCRMVQFIGGEPTLNKSLPDFIRHAHGLGYEYIEVYSNLLHMSDELVSLIQEKGVHVATSIYGATSEMHANVTKNKTSHARTMGNLLRLKNLGVPVRAGVIKMEQNETGVDDALAYLEGLGIQAGLDRVRHFGRANDDGEKQITELCGTCAGGTLRVGPDGSVSPCNMSAGWNVGSVRDVSLTDILLAGELTALRKEIHEKVVVPQQEEVTNCNPQCHPYPSCCPSTQHCNPCAPHLCHPCRPSHP